MPTFRHDGQRLDYATFGEGSRHVVLIPGLLLPQTMQWPLARHLAEHGNHVLTFDPIGHGRSDRPADMRRYSMTGIGRQAIALLEHLDIAEAVVGGTSLGANATLEAAALAPDRVRGMIVEMPVLDHALVGCAVAFTPILVFLTAGRPLARALTSAVRRIPRRGLPALAEVGLDWIGQDPDPSAAMLQGLFFNRIAPPQALRRTFEAPTLVIGHPRDPVHPFSDAGALVEELPNARLAHASWILELRLKPARLSKEISDFVEECWRPREATPRGRRRAAAS